jgi:hypothetical protein
VIAEMAAQCLIFEAVRFETSDFRLWLACQHQVGAADADQPPSISANNDCS